MQAGASDVLDATHEGCMASIYSAKITSGKVLGLTDSLHREVVAYPPIKSYLVNI
jgi:hypothetical protein